MFRKILSLAVEAAKEEVRLWKTPPRALEAHIEPELVIEVKPVPEQSVTAAVRTPDLARWQSSKFHTDTLKSTTCPNCGGAKRVNFYRCSPCHVDAVKAAS